ncbi:glycosyltransferase involved in cell wall biosynthesis [Geobacillus thermodenitrificans]|uniref:glycosyltransferase family 4 protein n=1 Tax=Geobacillus thermodenitrificans TaxID=33940 RepID=UPI002DFAADA7|nr:glycosyltransferase involved in cell wall biosynthesis [Geobacillus thermodenitrificans]
MKILYIHQYFSTRNGTTGTRSYEFSKYLVKQGHAVTMLTSNVFVKSLEPKKTHILYDEYEIDGIRVVAIKNDYSNYMSYFKRIQSFLKFMVLAIYIALKLDRHDIVYATSTPLTVALPALIIKKIKKVPFVFEVRDLWPEAPIQIGAIKSPFLIKILRAFEKKTYEEASNIVALSPGMEEGIVSTGISSSKVRMIPNCSDIDLFGKEINEKDRQALIKKYQLHGKFVVIHGGSMGVANGLDYIIKAAIELKKLGDRDIVFILTGDGKTKPYLEQMCKENNLDNVIFTGAVPRQEMPSLLAISDITITSFKNIPILATNSPNKFFDSLAASKPVIVNSNGWTRNVVENHNIGYYVDPDHPIQLAQLLLEIKGKKGMLKEMGKKARNLAEEKFERIKLAKQVERVLLDVLENK